MAKGMHKSTLALVACAAFAVGVGVADRVGYSQTVLAGAAVVGVVGAVAGGRSWLRPVSVAAIFLIGGVLRASAVPVYDSNPYGEYIEFSGTVVREPELRTAKQQLAVESGQLAGLVQLFLPLQPRIQYGDVLEVGCMLQQPEPFDGFAYDKYLERFQISSLCHYPSVRVVSRKVSLKARLFDLKSRLKRGFQHAVSPPEQTVVLGALFGDKRAIPDGLMDAFRASGTSHLLVISGLHVSLITGMISAVLKQMPIPRRMMIAGVVSLLVLYVVLTGWQPSATRAMVFGSTVLVAELFGRRSASLRLLCIAGAGMLAVNPLLLQYDAGFQLSFLATAGILILQPWFERRSVAIPPLLGLRSCFATSVAAIVATAPVILYSFHQFSLVALVANLALVPLMPVVMVLSILAAMIALCFPAGASLLGVVLYCLLHLMVGLVRWFAALPYASIELPALPHWMFWAMLAGVAAFGMRVLFLPEPVNDES